jgi:hypothetical protein
MTPVHIIHPGLKEAFSRLGINIQENIDSHQSRTLEMDEHTVTVPGQLYLLLSSMASASGAYFLDAWDDYPSTKDLSSFQPVTFAGPDWISEYECLTLHPYLSFLHDQNYSYYLVRADDPEPDNPRVYFIDHDSFEGDASDWGITLANFLSKLIAKAELDALVSAAGADVMDGALRSRMSPKPYRKDQTSLNAGGAKISNLAGIGLCPHLKWIELYSNQISNLGPLGDLQEVEALNLRNNRITDLTALRPLTPLKRLDLQENQIKDLSPLKGLTRLTWLQLDQNQIEDIAPLAALSNLEGLTLSGNAIRNVGTLGNLTGLKTLYLSGNPIEDFSPLEGLKNLENLHLENTGLTDLDLLSGMPGLTSLKIGRNAIRDFSALKGLKNLQYLYIEETGFSDARLLEGMDQLSTLWIWGNPELEHAAVLTQMPNLSDISRVKPAWIT